jgi:hypothetical protein
VKAEGTLRYDYEDGYCGELIAANGVTVATFVDEPSTEDARRLVACWNACVGLTIEQIEERTAGVAVTDGKAFSPNHRRLDGSGEGE